MAKVILCADDSVTMQTVAEITFRGTDYAYVGARTSDEALDRARSQRPALVLADAVMPGKTGYDLCAAIKADPAMADVPVVILCGNSAPYDAARGAQVGADGTLTKPWDTQVMLDKVGEILDKIAQTGVARAGAPGATAAPAHVAARPAPTPTPAPPMGQPMPIAAAAAAAPPKVAPPRSATIMGMPTIKMPGPGGAPAPVAAPAPISPPAPVAPPIAAPRPVAPPVAAPAMAAAAPPRPAAAAAAPAPAGPVGRPSMVGGIPTKRSALVERTLAKMGQRLAELSGLEPGSPELIALLKLSTEVVERVVWEVVPELAEAIIRENLQDLAQRRPSN